MMKTIELQKQKIYCGNLMLVNAKYPLKTDDASNLIPADMRFPDILMKRDAANVLQLIIEKLSAEKSIIPVLRIGLNNIATDGRWAHANPF